MFKGEKSLKQRLRDGERVFGVFYKTGSPIVTEILGYAGFDFLIIDCEHSPLSYGEVEEVIRTAENVGLSVIVRVPSASDEHIFHALDSGADGVQIPNMTTAEQVEQVVKYAKYYPAGNRGLSKNTRAAKFGSWWSQLHQEDYVQYANDRTLVAVHIENRQMVDQVEDICKDPNIDVLFVGPGDLSQSLGIPGQNNDPRVVELAIKVFETCKAYGKASGIYCANPAGLEKYINQGITYVVYGSDATMFTKAAKDAKALFTQFQD